MGHMKGQIVVLLSQNPEMFFTLLALPSTKGRDRGYPAGDFPVTARAGRIVTNSPEMFTNGLVVSTRLNESGPSTNMAAICHL